jgi:hypothetical protein
MTGPNERRTGPAQKGGGEGGGEEVAPVAGEAMTRIVTSTYRYKRPPRKRKPVLIEVPAIVTPRKRAVLPTDEPKLPPPAAPPPANDDWPAETAPLPAARKKSAIVTPSKRGRRPKPEPEIDADAEARVQAFLARMVRPARADGYRDLVRDEPPQLVRAAAVTDSATPARRFPPPWRVARTTGGWRIEDATGQPLAYVYGDD